MFKKFWVMERLTNGKGRMALETDCINAKNGMVACICGEPAADVASVETYFKGEEGQTHRLIEDYPCEHSAEAEEPMFTEAEIFDSIAHIESVVSACFD